MFDQMLDQMLDQTLELFVERLAVRGIRPRDFATTGRMGSMDDGVPRSVGRVLDLLEVVIAEGSCNLSRAALATELTPTTALRHLRALETRGYLARDETGAFSAGPTLLRIAAGLHDEAPLAQLITAARPHLQALSAETGESCYLAVGDGRMATYVANAESPRAIRHVGWVGQSVPLEGTAIGQAWARPGRPAARTGAIEPDITAVALALPPFGSLSAAVSVIGPAHRMKGAALKMVKQSITGTVARVAQDLGLSVAEMAS